MSFPTTATEPPTAPDCDCGDRDCPECAAWYDAEADWAEAALAADPHCADGLPHWAALSYAIRELDRRNVAKAVAA